MKRLRRAGIIGVFFAFMLLLPARAEDWADLSADYVSYTRSADPITAGLHGDVDAARRWPDNSPAAIAKRRDALEAFKKRLAAIDVESLSSEDAESHAVMTRQVDLALESIAFGEERMPFLNGEGFYTLPETVAATSNLADESAADAWIARLAAAPAFYARETGNMKRGIADGFTQPRLVVETAIETMEGLATEPPEKSALLVPFATLPASVPEKRRAALKNKAIKTIRDKVRPAQAKLARFFREEYLPAARPGLGARTLPDGDRYYAYLVRRYTTTDMTPDEVHAAGVREVARIRGKMDKVLAEIGFDGGVRELADKLAADPAFHPESLEDYVEKISEIGKRTDYLLPRYFGVLPRLTYGVRAKPAGLDSISSGYFPGSPEQGVAGAVVYSPTSAPKTTTYSLAAWMLHEGVPGHHLQIALAQENKALPEYRRNDDVTAFVEGWALYSERLGEEMGIYRTPYEQFGRLSLEMWRACRLVMDTGVHWLGWSRDETAQCMLDNTAMGEEGVYRETDRYIGWPGQALAYKIGEMKIVELRDRAEKALGEDFDIRAFHDVVLSGGALPLNLLEPKIDAWIAEQKKK